MKRAVFARQDSRDLAVVGDDDAGTRALADSLAGHPATLLRISGEHPADIWAEGRSLRDDLVRALDQLTDWLAGPAAPAVAAAPATKESEA